MLDTLMRSVSFEWAVIFTLVIVLVWMLITRATFNAMKRKYDGLLDNHCKVLLEVNAAVKDTNNRIDRERNDNLEIIVSQLRAMNMRLSNIEVNTCKE